MGGMKGTLTMTTTLAEQRAELAKKENYTYDPANFPGSQGWRANQLARRALSEFDAAHPEILAQIKADREAKDAANRARIMGGDVLGM